MKRLFLLSLLLVPATLWAKDPVYTGVFSNLAVSGYDTVAYFTEGKPVEGDSDFETEWNGATWRFSSQETLIYLQPTPKSMLRNTAATARGRCRKTKRLRPILSSFMSRTASSI